MDAGCLMLDQHILILIAVVVAIAIAFETEAEADAEADMEALTCWFPVHGIDDGLFVQGLERCGD